MVTVQRMIEMVGIPTTLITVVPEESRQARPPRALAPVGYGPGRSLGEPNAPELQRAIILDALGLLRGPPQLGEVILRSY